MADSAEQLSDHITNNVDVVVSSPTEDENQEYAGAAGGSTEEKGTNGDGDGDDGGNIELNTDDEDMVIRLGQVIPNYKQYLKDTVREVYCASEMTLLSVDLVTQTFEVELEMRLYWKQPELSKYIKEDQTWSMFDDQFAIPIDLDDPFDSDLALEWIEQEYSYDHETGVVELLLHLKDKFAERMELERFPVDRQFLNIKLMGRSGEEEGNWVWISSAGEDSSEADDNYPDWVPEDHRGRKQLQARLGPAVAEYIMFPPWADFNILQTPKPGYNHCLDEQPPFKLRFRVQRYPGFYVGSIITPMVLIIVCCYSSLAISPQDVADRLSVSITLMLATVAFKFVTSTILPPVSYLTWMDKYMTIMFIVIALFVFDNACAKYFGGPTFDLLFAIVVGVVLVSTTGFMLYALYTDTMRLDWHAMDAEDRNSDEDDFQVAEKGMILGPKNEKASETNIQKAQDLWEEWKKDPKKWDAEHGNKKQQ